MPPVPFTLRQLEYFDAVASEGSLVAASRRCRISASALGLALDELERGLRLQLFIRRKGQGMILTSVGLRFLSTARQLLADAESLAGDAVAVGDSLSGSYGVGCFSTLGPFYLPPILEDFAGRHEGLRLAVQEASTPELTHQLLQGRIDAALMYEVDVSPQLVSTPIHRARPHLIVGGDHPLAGAGSVNLSQLTDAPLIVLDVEPTRQNTDQLLGRLGVSPPVAHTVGSFELARCLVGRGLGWAVMFQRPRSPVSYDGRPVVELEINDQVPETTLCLARTAGSPPTAKFDALAGFLQGFHASPRDVTVEAESRR